MAQNTNPIFTLVPDIQWGSVDDNSTATAGPILTANTAMNGTGYVTTVFTAGTNGSYVQRLRCKSAGTNTVTVLRIFINNGSTNATAANNILYDEISLPGTTASTTTAVQAMEIPLSFPLPGGYKINVTLGATTSPGWYVTVLGGDY
jgi:hypothetical protein